MSPLSVLLPLFLFCAACDANAPTEGVFAPFAWQKFRILGLFGYPGKSHFDVFKPLLEELARRGHDVTVISYFPRVKNSEPLPNYRDVDLTRKENKHAVNAITLENMAYSVLDILRGQAYLKLWSIENCQDALANAEVRRLINSTARYDLIITEIFNSDCLLGFVHKFQAPFIALSSHQIMPWANARFGNPDDPSYIPTIFLGFSTRMSFFERVLNVAALWRYKYTFNFEFNRPVQSMVEEAFGPNVPPLGEIAKNVSALLVNTHHSLHGVRPYLPNVVQVGGLHIQPSKPLPSDIAKFLDDAHEGAVLFSWGSMVKASSIGPKMLTEVLQVIASLPQKVIWKWEQEDLPGKPKNLMVKKWLPQADILRHPNVKCYLAHGGLLGLSEGVYAGVPMIITPIFGDQFHNAAAAVERGVAISMTIDQVNGKNLKAAFDAIFNDTRYAENARALSKAYRDRSATPLETAVWWSEYIARGNGQRFLENVSRDLPWYQYYLLDVYSFFALVALLILIAIRKVSASVLYFARGCATKKISVNGKKID